MASCIAVLLASLGALVTTQVAEAAEWWYVSSGDQMALFVDRTSVSSASAPGHTALKAWDAVYNSTPEDGVKSSKTMRYYDCADRSVAMKSRINYGPNQSLINSNTWRDFELNWRPVAPDTVGESLLKFVCNAENGAGESTVFSVEGDTFYFVGDLEDAAKTFTPTATQAQKVNPAPSSPARKTIPKR